MSIKMSATILLTGPFDRPNRVVDRIQLGTLGTKGGNRPPLERVCIPFLDLLTAKHPVRCQQDRVLREKRGQSGGIAVAMPAHMQSIPCHRT
jgi:hypothetical protein